MPPSAETCRPSPGPFALQSLPGAGQRVPGVREADRSLSAPPAFPSYKLWYRYLKARRAQVKHRCVTDPAYEDVNNCHERAFVFMHKVGAGGRGRARAEGEVQVDGDRGMGVLSPRCARG